MDEKSAGAVVYRDTPGGRMFLLLRNQGRWDFPKGGIEKGENELQTMLREVGEETGLTDLTLIPGFRKVIEYFYRREGRNIRKQVVYLLVRTKEEGVKISFEHQGYGWYNYPEAMVKASYDNSRATLAEAEEYLKGTPDGGVRTGPEGGARRASPP